MYQADKYLDCMESLELEEFIFWTDDGEYMLEILIGEKERQALKNIKLFLLFLLSRAINGGFKNFKNRFLTLSILGGSICIFVSNNFKKDFIVILLLSFILSASVKRVSNNFILSRATGHLSMNLLIPDEYRSLSYKDNKSEISKKLKKGFIKGILEASRHRKILRFSTHKWFVENVVLDKRIKSSFNIAIKRKKKGAIIATEVLSLFSFKEVIADKEYALNTSIKKRDCYYVVLKKKRGDLS